MAGLVLLGGPMVASCVLSPAIVFGLSFLPAIRERILLWSLVAIGSAASIIALFPPGGANDGKNWTTFMLMLTVILSSIGALVWTGLLALLRWVIG